MDVEITDKRQNPLLNRQEVRFKILHPKEPTPTRDSARDKLASMNNVKKEQVIIDALDTTFGKSETTGYAKIYPTKDEAMKNERNYELVRNNLVAGKKAPEKKAPTLTTGPAPKPNTGDAAPAAAEEAAPDEEPAAESETKEDS